MKKPQTLGIDYEILDLDRDLDGASRGPARPARLIDDELAHLSGGLFDGVPRVEMPLDSFFPPPPEDLRAPRVPRLDSLLPAGSPARSDSLGLLPPRFPARSDSLVPLEADASYTVAPPAAEQNTKSAFVRRWSGIVTAAAFGMMATALVLRPEARPAAPAPALAALPAATAPAKAPAPVQVEATVAKPAKPAITAPVAAAAVKPARPVAAASPVRDEPAPAAAPTADPLATEVAPSAPPPVDPLHRPEPAAPGVAPQRAAIAIAAAARGAGSCLDADDLRRTMAVSVTFGPSGHATRAIIEGGPHRGTAVGSCIAQRLRSAAVAPFEGPAVTIRTSISAR